MKIDNTLSRKVEKFEPIDPPKVGLYTCGPTVYDYPHIGNWRAFVFGDILKRTLEFNGYQVRHVMNITDVGHLTGDNVGNADLGEDRMEKAAKRENKTAWDIAEFYIDDFVKTRSWLNILPPDVLPRATDHISEQIDLIKRLEEKGLTYRTKLGVYFDVAKFPDYGKLGGQKLVDKRVATRDELKEDADKRNPFDFALWKFSLPGEKRQMEWESPWGVGYPGWHIECSAMSMKYLGETLDIHTGGVDHIAIHHTNEIAQSEGATGKLFSKYWMHSEFLTVDGGRMGKSLGNAYTIHDVTKKGFDPLSLRYFYLGAHYRTVLNFTWEGLDGAQNALNKLRVKFLEAMQEVGTGTKIDNDYLPQFTEAINEDLNTPKALAVVWKTIEDKTLAPKIKYDLLLKFDQVLGLGLGQITINNQQVEIPEAVQKLLDTRNALRAEKKFKEADAAREEIEKMGYTIVDSTEGSRVVPK